MKFLSFKHSGSETKILPFDDTMTRIGSKMRSPRLLLTGRAPKSLPTPRARHWTTPTCHNSHKTLTSLHTIEIHKEDLCN
jgi:hypothetical protein